MSIIESVEAHYETLEVPFGRIYQWHQAHLTLECDCGETLTFSGTSGITTCRRCGAAYSALVHEIHYREEHLHYDDAHPWRYDDVTAGLDDEQRWKKATTKPLYTPSSASAERKNHAC